MNKRILSSGWKCVYKVTAIKIKKRLKSHVIKTTWLKTDKSQNNQKVLRWLEKIVNIITWLMEWINCDEQDWNK